MAGRVVAFGLWQAVAVGLAVGLAGAYALSRFVESFLFRVEPGDPMVYLGTAIYSAADAPSAVRRYNARARGSAGSTSRVTPLLRPAPAPRPGDRHASAPAFGLRIR